MNERLTKTLSLVANARELVELRKTIFRSPAGKKRIADRMVKLIPSHKVYVEPFVGSGAVFFEKEAAPVSVLNDLDPEIAGAFSALAALDDDGVSKLGGMNWMGSRKAFDKLRASAPQGELEKLHRFLYMRNFSYGGFGKSFADSNEGRSANALPRIRRCQPKLKSVKVHCGDYEDVVRKYDSPDTFFFLDPPYVGFDSGVGEGQFDEQRFMKVLRSIKGKFLVNYGVRGELPKLARQEKGFCVRRIKTRRVFANWKGSGTISHLLISNYDPAVKSVDGLGELEEVTLEDLEKGESPLDMLLAAVPPNEWSGAVAGFLGPERRKAISDYWESLTPVEQKAAYAEWEANMSRANDAEKAKDKSSFCKASALIKGVNPDDERFVMGIVLKPEDIDAQGDIYSAEEIRQAAHKFMADFGGLGFMHRDNVNGKVKILESYIAPQDLTFGSDTITKGTWLLAVRVIDDELWSMVKSGQLTGFSIGGSARRVPTDQTA